MKESDEKSYKFEIGLIVIAVLIPLFLESIPTFADRLTELFVLPLNFNIIRIISLGLGLIWFGVLLTGLYEFNTPSRNFFHKVFEISSGITIGSCLFLLILYPLYLITFFVGYKTVIYTLAVIIGIVTGFSGVKQYAKEKK